MVQSNKFRFHDLQEKVSKVYRLMQESKNQLRDYEGFDFLLSELDQVEVHLAQKNTKFQIFQYPTNNEGHLFELLELVVELYLLIDKQFNFYLVSYGELFSLCGLLDDFSIFLKKKYF